MQFNCQFFVLSAIVGLAAGAPASQAQAQDSVELCHDTNFRTNCVVANNSQGKCNNVGSRDNDVISSVHLGPNTACRFWADGNCQGRSIIVRSDAPDLRTLGFNDVISSFTCFPA